MGALSVASPTPQPKLTVGVAKGGMQGSTYNPQQTAPSTILQNPTTAQQLQPTYNPQPRTYNPQPAAHVIAPSPTAADVAAAAEAVRVAQAQEIARQKEVARVHVQGQVDSNVAGAKAATISTISAPTWRGNLKVGAPAPLPKISLPAQTEYDKAYAAAYNKALADYNKQKQPGKQGFWQKLGDKVSFGQDRRDMAARSYAEKQAQSVESKSISTYEANLNAFLAEQAKQKANIESKKFASQSEFDQALKEYTAWESKGISSLEATRASITAKIDAYGTASSSKLTSATAKTFGWAGSALGKVENNPIWKYTLGQGSKNAPSLVTAPGRVVNWIGNLNTANRTIYKEDGSKINRQGSKLNAWQAAEGQRSFNIKPWTDVKYDPGKAEKMFGKQIDQKIAEAKSLSGKKIGWTGTTGGGKVADPKTLTRDYWRQQLWKGYNAEHRFNNSVLDNVADPLNLAVGAGSIAKGLGAAGKVAEIGRASKATAWAFKAADKVGEAKNALADTKLVKWLGSEAKTPGQKLADAIAESKAAQGATQDTLLPRINELNTKLAAGSTKLDVSVFQDLKGLSESEAKVVQRMVDGKITGRDRLFLAGSNNAPVREKLEGIATKWQSFTEQMKLADNVKSTRFGAGQKTYSPRTSWIAGKEGNLDNYNFKLFRKKGVQSSGDFYQGAVDRYFKSSLDDKFAATATGKTARRVAERDALLKRYDQIMNPARENVEKAYAKSRTPWARAQGVVGAPVRLWKKSVLALRPAWTVNNALYNTQAGVLAGGAGALAEQAKMLNPRYWRKAMDESRAAFGGNLSKEIGKGRLNKFYNGVEDWSRVAAGRAAMKKGLTEEQSLKRVNKYLFDYKTANWERPLKTVVPFWSFQKNLAKAAASMPFDRPGAAIAYNRLDRYQQEQYSKDFATLIPKLKQLGYTDQEIAKFKQDNEKYYHGKLKVGDKWFNTPFNAFSEKGMTTAGINPYLAAASEAANSQDQFGRTIKGKNATFGSRVGSKFPQIDLANQAKQSWAINSGKSKPSTSWIAKPGSDGFGMTKQKQGYDTKAANYDRSLDPRAKLGQNTAAFFGVPRATEFDKNQFIKSKTLQKASQAYFANGWKIDGKTMPDKQARYLAEQDNLKKMLAKYGLTPDSFFKGVLAKYDTTNTKNIKNMKEQANKATNSLYEEYGKQPKGTRNLWATQKLRTLVDQGYFDKNPFLKSFDWTNPGSVAKADKQALVSDAVKTGDWSKYQKKYGLTQKQKDYQYANSSGDWSKWRSKYGLTAKAQARETAVKTGDWSKYAAMYGVSSKQTPFQFDGKFFKTADTMQKYKDGQFWATYAKGTPTDRKQLLVNNPQYNTRGNWTAKQWLQWRTANTNKTNAALRSVAGFTQKEAEIKAKTATKVIKYSGSLHRRTKKIVYSA